MMEALESEEEEGDLTEEAKPKAKKKGKNSPAASRKDRSATPDVSFNQVRKIRIGNQSSVQFHVTILLMEFVI